MKHALALIASAALLVACGGGGGGSTPESETPPPTASAFDVTGVAAKGPMAGAIVTAHAVNADGTIRAEALATAEAPTDAQGRYRIRFEGAAAQPYVLKVSVPATGATHRDEVSGQLQSLPPGLVLRAVLVPAATGTLTANLTPFSEMAAEAAEDAGITAASAREANATIKQMLGITGTGDLTAVPVKSTSEAGTADEQRLALMLTAVSQMAASGAAGCSGSEGERALCVVQTLADAVTAPGSLALSGTAAPALLAALETVVSTPALIGSIPPSVVAPAIGALQCEGTACSAPPPATGVDAAGAIAATKTLFTELRSDIVALFGDRGSVDPGALEVETNKFGATMRGVQAPAEMLAKDAGTMIMGIDLYNDYRAGRTSVSSRGRAPGEFIGSDGFGPSSMVNAASCALFQDSSLTLRATAPGNANVIACSANYYVAFATGTEYAHSFSITPGAAAGSWSYVSRARERRNGAPTVTLAPAAGLASGSLTTTVDSLGRIVSFSATGALPGAFATGTSTLVSDSHQWDISGTRRIDANDPKLSTTSLSGSVVAKNADGATLGTLTIRSAALSEIPVSRDANGFIVAPHSPSAVASWGGEIASGAFDLVWAVPGAQFEGVFAASDSAWDKSLRHHAPTRFTLQGRLSNIESGVKTDFIAGKLTVALLGWEQFDGSAPMSSSNFVTLNAAFTGTMTAPGRPLLAVALGTTARSHESVPASATLQYRSFSGSTARLAINVEATMGSDGVPVVTISDVTHAISVTTRGDASSADVMLDGATRIGTLNPATGVLTFTDGSFVSVTF